MVRIYDNMDLALELFRDVGAAQATTGHACHFTDYDPAFAIPAFQTLVLFSDRALSSQFFDRRRCGENDNTVVPEIR